MLGGGEFAAAHAVGSDELSIAKLADCALAVGFATAPEIASRKATEHCGAATLGTFALQGFEDFFD
jgi:hypothetical protein